MGSSRGVDRLNGWTNAQRVASYPHQADEPPWTKVDLEPADVVQVALDDGTLLNVRLLETELGANLELAWKTVLEESSSYTVTPVPGGGLNYLPQVDPVSSEARLFLLDVPLIRDSDDAGRAATGHYWAAGAYFDPPWRGAVRLCHVNSLRCGGSK